MQLEETEMQLKLSTF